MTSTQSVFTRNATGLVRSISPTVMLFMNLGEIAFGTAILSVNFYNGSPFAANGGYLGGNGVYATLIFMLIGVFEAYIYYQVIRSVGRTGGDYVWISRTLGPVTGGFLTLGFVFTGLPFIAVSLNWLWTLSLGPSFSAVYAVAPSYGGGLATWMASLGLNASGNAHAQILAISLIVFAIFMLVNFVSPRSGFLLLAGVVVIALIGTFMMVGVYVWFGASGMQHAVSNFLVANGGTSTDYTSIAKSGAPFNWTNTILLLPAIAYAIPWINNAAGFSGELKSLNKSAWMSTFLPILLSGAFIAIFLQLYYSSLGFGFVMGSSTLANGLANTFVYPNMLTVATIAMGSNPLFIWVMNVAFAFWYLASLQQTILAISRYGLGMSFDRLIPVQLSKVSDRFHSPVAILGLVTVLAIPMMVIAAYEDWLTIYSTGAMGMLFFAFMGVTAIVYGYKKRDSLKGSSGALIISGVIVGAFFLYMTYLFLTDSVYGINAISWEIMIPIWILGALLYPISKAYYGSRKIDLAVAFKELPPE
jgi:amino acid transporter